MEKMTLDLLTVAEAAECLRVRQQTVWKWAAARKIGYVRAGRVIRIPEAEINRLVQEGTVCRAIPLNPEQTERNSVPATPTPVHPVENPKDRGYGVAAIPEAHPKKPIQPDEEGQNRQKAKNKAMWEKRQRRRLANGGAQ